VDRRSLEGIEAVIQRCEAIQGQLWEQAVTLRRETGDTALNLYLATLNDLIDTDARRRAVAFSNRFPNALWGTLFFLLTIATVMLGINSGLHGRRSRLACSALIVAFSLVVVLIIDLDRPVTELVQQRRSLMPSDN
jgi:hypothetical protein